MNSIIITGGAGYIVSHAVKLFFEKGFKVYVIDNLENGYQQPLDILKDYGELEFIKADLRNKEEFKKAFENIKADAVLHFAALCSVNESVEQPEKYFENNVIGTKNLLEVMKEHGIKNIIFSSTCATYGETQYLPVDEKHPLAPTNPYGQTKLEAEKVIKESGINYVILRYFNVCGADSQGVVGDSKKPSSLLVQNAVRGAMGIEEFKFTCPEVDTPDKSPIRDYINVEDLVQAHFKAYEYLVKGGSSEIINLGTGVGSSVREIVKKVEEILGVTLKEKKGEQRKGEYAKIYADFSKAKKLLGWQPEKSLEQSIKSLEKWYKNFPNGYDN